MQPDLIDGLCDKITAEFMAADVLFHAEIPVEKHVIKKNRRPVFMNKKTGARFIGKSQELKEAERYLELTLKSRINELGIESPILGPIWVIMLFYYQNDVFYTKKGEPSKLRGDLSNLYQLVEDCLESSGVIGNDDQICSHDLSRRLPSDRTKLEIFVLRHKFDFIPG